MSMKVLRCGDVVPGCDHTVEGADEDEVLRKAARHAEEAHGVKDMSPELVSQVKGAIRDLPSGGEPPKEGGYP